jgi:translocator protein
MKRGDYSMKKREIFELLTFLGITYMAAIIGGTGTSAGLDQWYRSLEKPQFNPPDYVFGPVWTLLYTMMGISAYLVYEQGWNKLQVRRALTLYFIQLGLNALWPISFFSLRSTTLGLVNIVLLWIAIMLTIGAFYRISKKSAYLLIPYILWVTFAMILNFSLWDLNR